MSPEAPQSYQVKCIKCLEVYVSDDPDAYYCELCNNARKVLARKIDKQLGPQIEAAKVHQPSFEERIAAMPKVGGLTIVGSTSGGKVKFYG